MPNRPRATDVPRSGPLQIGVLADGRLLLRGPGGVSLLGGVARADLERVLGVVDGRRTAGEICEQLADDFEPAAVLNLLRHLTGLLGAEESRGAEIVSRAADPTWPLSSHLLVLGDGIIAARVAEKLGVVATASLPERALEAQVRSQELVVCALEDESYETCFEIQQMCLRLNVASLFLTADADGVRIGPSTSPGVGPCLACAQLAGFRTLQSSGVNASDLLAAVASFRTSTLDHQLEASANAVAREAQALLHPGGRPDLLASIKRLTATRQTTYPVSPVVDCPLCASLTPATDTTWAEATRRELVDRDRASPRWTPGHRGSADDLCTSVGIVGGGTAGYLTAMALKRKFPNLEVTLIESSAIPVIGVGEATTPLMPQFLHVDLGLDIQEFFAEVAPTLKLGIRFEWGPRGQGFNYPFGPVHVLEPAIYDGDIRRCSPRSLLIDANAVPLTAENGRWHSDFGVDTAYHLDNRRFVHYLERKAKDFAVRTVDAKISHVEIDDTGDSVTGLVAEDGRRFTFDLYVDASGFRSLLLGQALESPFQSYGNSLFTDRALIASVPLAAEEAIRPATLAETLEAGWCWSTPQRDADHRGYVFCSAYASPDEAEREMRRLCPTMGDPKLIQYRTGRREQFWRGNVVAMGNAYGFVEPLESTALHMLIRQIGLLLGAFPIRREERGIAAVLNRKVAAWWDYLRWFLAIHYRFNRRLDTPFWRHCQSQTDVSAYGELLELYRERGPLSYQSRSLRIDQTPDPLWGAEGIDVLLLGQQVPTQHPKPTLSAKDWQQRASLYQAATTGAMPQGRALEALERKPEILARWVAELKRVGPAFG